MLLDLTKGVHPQFLVSYFGGQRNRLEGEEIGMAYVIEYGGQVGAELRMRKRGNWKWVGAVCLLMGAIAVRYFWGDVLTSFLIPGDDAATVDAFSELLSGLGEGETFSECVTAFCREVIHGPS